MSQEKFYGFEFVKESGGIKEYTMTSNGLRVLLKQDNTAPVATFMVTYEVGSRNEAIGYTGSTHLLEHLMFKGSRKFNTKKGNSVFQTLQSLGARMNATTWLDRTNYFAVLPSEHLFICYTVFLNFFILINNCFFYCFVINIWRKVCINSKQTRVPK